MNDPDRELQEWLRRVHRQQDFAAWALLAVLVLFSIVLLAVSA